MSMLWGVPFAGILLSIATGPLLIHHWWHAHYGKAAAFWGLLAFVPMVAFFGIEPAAIEGTAPLWFGDATPRGRYIGFRSHAGRSTQS